MLFATNVVKSKAMKIDGRVIKPSVIPLASSHWDRSESLFRAWVGEIRSPCPGLSNSS
jgi:hypothetical protein